MDWQAMAWELANSNAFIAIIASAVLYGLNKMYAKKPLWEKYQGTLIKGIKFAEKTIPDDTENKALHRFDTALKYAITVFEQVEQRQITEAEKAELAEGVSIKHAELEAAEGL